MENYERGQGQMMPNGHVASLFCRPQDQLLRHEGFDAFTMNKLAAAADLAKGTLNLYFATREELVLALYTDLHEGWIHRFIDAEKQTVTARL